MKDTILIFGKEVPLEETHKFLKLNPSDKILIIGQCKRITVDGFGNIENLDEDGINYSPPEKIEIMTELSDRIEMQEMCKSIEVEGKIEPKSYNKFIPKPIGRQRRK